MKEVTLSLCRHKVISQLSWQDVHESYGPRFPNILPIFDLVLSLPAGSSVCERGFSAMKTIKSQYRNRLAASKVSDLMVVKMHSPDIQSFEPAKAIDRWNHSSKRPRRPLAGMDPEDSIHLNHPVEDFASCQEAAPQECSYIDMSDSESDEIETDFESDTEDCMDEYSDVI